MDRRIKGNCGIGHVVSHLWKFERDSSKAKEKRGKGSPDVHSDIGK